MEDGTVLYSARGSARRCYFVPSSPGFGDAYGAVEIDFNNVRAFRINQAGATRWLAQPLFDESKSVMTVYRAMRPRPRGERWPWRIRWQTPRQFVDGAIGLDTAAAVSLSCSAFLLWHRADGARRAYPFAVTGVSRGGGFETFAALTFGGEYGGYSVERGGRRSLTLSARGLDPATMVEMASLSEATNATLRMYDGDSPRPLVRAAVTALSWDDARGDVDVTIEVLGEARGSSTGDASEAFSAGPSPQRPPAPAPEPEPEQKEFAANGARYVTAVDGARVPISFSIDFDGNRYYFYLEDFIHKLGLSQEPNGDGRTINEYYFFNAQETPKALRLGALGASTGVSEFLELWNAIFNHPTILETLDTSVRGDMAGLMSAVELTEFAEADITVFLRTSATSFIGKVVDIDPAGTFESRCVSAFARWRFTRLGTAARVELMTKWTDSVIASMHKYTETSAKVFPADATITLK